MHPYSLSLDKFEDVDSLAGYRDLIYRLYISTQ